MGRPEYFVRFGEAFWATLVAAANRGSARSSVGRCMLNYRTVFVVTLYDKHILISDYFGEWYLFNLFNSVVSYALMVPFCLAL